MRTQQQPLKLPHPSLTTHAPGSEAPVAALLGPPPARATVQWPVQVCASAAA